MGILDFAHNQLINIYSVTTNGYGDAVETLKYSNTKCRFQLKTGLITTRKGEEKTYRAEVFLNPKYVVADFDRITYNGDKFVIIGIENRIDFQGAVDHRQLYLE